VNLKDPKNKNNKNSSSSSRSSKRLHPHITDTLYLRLCLVFLFYTFYTIINLTYHIYVVGLEQTVDGAARTLLFLRIVLG
jgi:hypothetical protein